ncbi:MULTISPECIES: preprotein translocase subunit SecE [unclassified Crossiella]|uniref:preprotein translocase subunit SecE n=1 Tax=unclassified Crossiella TaxID=2620835 RepID=UPI0020003E80|nr:MULTISPECIES: preprotein translocase subunit SecE [unclassified Crossiella]MCK2236817.1 preprotein translocase subunit SecE [Crossiella sp. S99.2]MCK2250485.1 preprotein translocase subunit SecE [Crossiella sp. S99.1]
MSEDREQETRPEEEKKDSSRPVTAASRRERRASARPERTRPGKKADESEAKGTKGRATPARRTKERKGNPIKRLGRFFREVFSELRKVIWPTRKQLVTYTAVVLVFVTFMVALVTGLDLAFVQGVTWLFDNK